MALALIFVPLIGAALMPILRKIWARGATILAFLITLYLVGVTAASAYLQLFAGKGKLLISQDLGGRIILNIDGFSLVALFSIGLVAMAALWFSLRFELDPDRRPGFNALILLAVTGMNGLAMVTDLFSLFVFLEILSISSFILIAFQTDGDGIEGSFKYMMLSAVATVFFLLATTIVFMFTGSVSFVEIQAFLAKQGGFTLLHLALGFSVFALALKAGVMPFHAWLPDAYTAAPAPVSVLLAGIVTKMAGVYTLFRVILAVFGFSGAFTGIMMLLGTISMMLGAFMALGQRDFKRMLAFSSISQIGYMMLGFATGTPLGILGAVFHFFNHAVFKSLLFLNAGAVEEATGTRNFDNLGGLSKKMPVTGFTSIIGLLSTAGIPPLAGFWSKLLIIIALWAAGYQWIAWFAILTSVVTLAYLLSLQREVFFGKLREGLENISEVAPAFYWPAIVLASLTIIVGVCYPFFFEKLLIPVQALVGLIGK